MSPHSLLLIQVVCGLTLWICFLVISCKKKLKTQIVYVIYYGSVLYSFYSFPESGFESLKIVCFASCDLWTKSKEIYKKI